MSERAPYSRVYWSIHEDAKFDGIRDDPKLMGSWLLLLVAADMAYPSPAYVVPTVSRSALARLVDAGLIDLLGGHRYRVHGLAAEREYRKQLATTRGPDADRTVPGRSPDGDQEGTKAKAKQRRDEEEAYDGRDDLEAFLEVRRRAPSEKQRRILDEVLDRHDVTGPAWSAAIIRANPDDPIGAVIAADKQWKAERMAEAIQAERRPRVNRPPSRPAAVRDLLEGWAEANSPKEPAA